MTNKQDILRTDKKANVEYWDKIDDTISEFAEKMINFSQSDMKSADIVDLTSDIREAVIAILNAYGGDFPYVDEDF